LETLWIILPYSVGVAAVGLLESLLTASSVDQMTDTRSDKNRHQDLPFFLGSGRAS
jgi:SulP family sulfate permease